MRSKKLLLGLACLVLMAFLPGCVPVNAVKVQDNLDPAPAGWIIEYTIRVKNYAPIGVTQGLVQADLPYGTVFVDADEGGRRVGRRVRWELGDVPAGATRVMHFRIRTFSTVRGYISTKVVVGAFPLGLVDEERELTLIVAP